MAWGCSLSGVCLRCSGTARPVCSLSGRPTCQGHPSPRPSASLTPRPRTYCVPGPWPGPLHLAPLAGGRSAGLADGAHGGPKGVAKAMTLEQRLLTKPRGLRRHGGRRRQSPLASASCWGCDVGTGLPRTHSAGAGSFPAVWIVKGEGDPGQKGGQTPPAPPVTLSVRSHRRRWLLAQPLPRRGGLHSSHEGSWSPPRPRPWGHVGAKQTQTPTATPACVLRGAKGGDTS